MFPKFQELLLIFNLVCLCVWCVSTCVCRCVHLCAGRERAEEGIWSLPVSFLLYFFETRFFTKPEIFPLADQSIRVTFGSHPQYCYYRHIQPCLDL